jgi:hypothetical protein
MESCLLDEMSDIQTDLIKAMDPIRDMIYREDLIIADGMDAYDEPTPAAQDFNLPLNIGVILGV